MEIALEGVDLHVVQRTPVQQIENAHPSSICFPLPVARTAAAGAGEPG
jgi:hypothetical protein